MHYRRLNNSDWKGVDERFQKRLSGWKGKLLSSGGKLVLINSVLSNLPLFMFLFFEVPREVLKKLDFYRSRFFWQSNENKKSIGLRNGVSYVFKGPRGVANLKSRCSK